MQFAPHDPIGNHDPEATTGFRRPRVSNRIWLFLLAITVHNIPEGLAVGVAFGSDIPGIGNRDSFVRARC